MDIITTSTAESVLKTVGKGHKVGPQDLAEIYERHRASCAAAGYPAPDFAAARAMLPPPQDLPLHDEPVGVIIETREHPALEPVICEMVDRLGLPVQVFHGKANAEAVRRGALAELVAEGKLHPVPLDDSLPLNKERYNALLLLPEFWERLIGRGRILIFQTDALLCPASPYRLEDFADFSYIGSPLRQREWHGISFHGGNGGLCLHYRDHALECLRRFPPEAWPSAEDRYFAFHMEFVGRVGRFHECAKFAAQREFIYPSFGAHNVVEMDHVDLARFLNYCPEGRRVLRRQKQPARSPFRRWQRALSTRQLRRKLDRLPQA